MRLWPRRKGRKAAGRRTFDAARQTSLLADWLGTAGAIDADLRGDLGRLRSRSRDLAQNNDYVKRFLAMVERNVVGPNGVNLQCRIEDAPGQPDTVANNLIEDAFDDWSRAGVCEVSGRLSFAALCRLIVRTVARDGEALIVRVEGAAARNPYGLALQLLDSARLDLNYNVDTLPGGGRIVMGVEVDGVGRPAAYHVNQANGSRLRLSAGNVYHLFTTDSPEQTRGYPWLHTAMIRLHNLKGYDEAAIIAARYGAQKIGMYVSPDGNPGDFATPGKDGKPQGT
ncbi:MAG TPA: phage portal protein, partial [Nevskiaceae bacterium]